MTRAMLVTGATGLLGTELTRTLADMTEDKIYVLVRAENDLAAAHRLKALWQGDWKLCEKIGLQIIPAAGDLTKKNLGLDRNTAKQIAAETGIVFHTAAEVGLQKDPQKTMRINRQGTARLTVSGPSERRPSRREASTYRSRKRHSAQSGTPGESLRRRRHHPAGVNR